MLTARVDGSYVELTGDLRADYDSYCDLEVIHFDRKRVLIANNRANRVLFGLEVEAPEPTAIELDGFKFKTKPFDHQLKIWSASKNKTHDAYFMEQGTGKSKVTIDVAAHLFQKGLIDNVVIVAPNNVHANWIKNEFPAHCPCPWGGFIYYAGEGMTQGEYVGEGPRLKVFAFNIEGFVSDKAKVLLKNIVDSKTLFVVDESSRIKNFKALRTKFLLSVAPKAGFTRILSGTPVTQGVQDLWSQFQFNSPAILNCRTFYVFRARYCVMGGFKAKQIIGYHNMEELQARIEANSHRVLKVDCLDLPAKVYQTLTFRLSPATRRLYDAVRKESLDILSDLLGHDAAGDVVTEMAMTRILRLQQITSGLMPDASGLEAPGDNARIVALLDRLEDITGKVIIFARFKADIQSICSRLPAGSFVQLHGGVASKDRPEVVKAFQEDPKIRYFVGNPAAAGIGITLTAAETVVYYSQDFNLEYRLQSEDRAHRIGQKKTVLYIDMIAEGTVDSKIVKAILSKHSLAKMILQDPIGVIS